jgi:tRNA A-37 threonylcarbamoyl transferase component Bud32
VLDPEAIVAALHPFLPETNGAAARMTYARYKPRKSCVVAYRLDRAGVTVDLYAKAHPTRALAKLRQPRRPGRILLEDGAIVVSIFPTDGKLKPLRRLADAQACHRLLRKLVPDRPDLWDPTIRGLRYMPERRYVAQLLADKGTAAVLKVYDEPDYPMARANAKAFRSDGPLQLARCLGHSDRYRILMFEWLAGRLLSEAISDPGLEIETLITVGAALAQLHIQKPEGLPCLTREVETSTLFALSANLQFLCPQLAVRLHQLIRQLATDLVHAPPVHDPIHGDFCAKQVLLGDNAAAILDLDRSVRGDPALDLGLFIAHLECEALNSALPANRLEPLIEALLEGYRSVTRRPIPVRVPLYTAVGLVRLAPDPFRYRESHWPERTEAILERAEAMRVASRFR